MIALHSGIIGGSCAVRVQARPSDAGTGVVVWVKVGRIKTKVGEGKGVTVGVLVGSGAGVGVCVGDGASNAV